MSEKKGRIISYNATNRLGEVQPEGTELRARFYLKVVTNPEPEPKPGDIVTFEAPEPRKSKSGKPVQGDATAITIVERPERAAPQFFRPDKQRDTRGRGRDGRRSDRRDQRPSRVGQTIGGIGREPIRVMREERTNDGERRPRGERRSRDGAPGERRERREGGRGRSPRQERQGRPARERREPAKPRITPLDLSIFPLPKDFNPTAVQLSSVNGSLILDKLTAWPKPKATEPQGPGHPAETAPSESPPLEAALRTHQPFSSLSERNQDYFYKNFFLPAFQTIQRNIPFGAIRARREELLELFRLRGYAVHARVLRSSSRIVMNLDYPSSLESAGIVLDRSFGYPILPASAIRGTLRQYLLRQAERQPRERKETEEKKGGDETPKANPQEVAQRLLKALGTHGTPGQITVFDAVPHKVPVIGAVDVSTCHHPAWFQNGEGEGPSDADSPEVTRFLSLRPGAEFSFSVVAEPQADGVDLAALIMEALVKALRTDGIGARTSLGYGRFNAIAAARTVKRPRRRRKKNVVASVSPSPNAEQAPPPPVQETPANTA